MNEITKHEAYCGDCAEKEMIERHSQYWKNHKWNGAGNTCKGIFIFLGYLGENLQMGCAQCGFKSYLKLHSISECPQNKDP